MSDKTIIATYSDGEFHPIDPESLNLANGQTVVLTVVPIDQATYVLALAKKVYAGLSDEEIAAIEQEFRHTLSSAKEEAEEPKQEQTV